MQKKDGSVSGESSRMERPIKLVIDGSPSHQRRAQTHRIGNVGHTRVSRDRGICSSSFAEFTSHRKSHNFRISIRVEAAPPSPPSSLPRIIQHHHLYSSLISRRIFVQIRSEICWDRNLRFRFYIFFSSARSIFFFFQFQIKTWQMRNLVRETNTDAERKDKRIAWLPTVPAVVSRLVKCNVRAV